ncbi:MAG: nucleotidyltransferase family protein [Eubacterium sp.]|nr:nucleotidyltransferase family protein [Eubacterium sp.]
MNVVGIVAEYNPFHAGHAYQIRKAKELAGADFCVVIMSGDFVQRGEPAFFDKYSRTKEALKNGADVVFELPVRFAVSSAGDFAYGAVQALDRLGIITHICFGSEYGEIDRFTETANVLLDADREGSIFQKVLTDALKNGSSYADARDAAITSVLSEKYPDDDFLKTPNNILGIEYCHALKKLNSNIVPITIKREGQAYDDGDTSAFNISSTDGDKEYPSSTALRAHLKSQNTPHIEADYFSDMVYYSLKNTFKYGKETNTHCPKDLSNDLANRIANSLDEFTTVTEFTEKIKTKAFTTSRIKRCLMQSLLGLSDVNNNVNCLRLLGFKEEASHIIKTIKDDNNQLHIITRLADDLPKLPSYDRGIYKSQDLFAADLYRNIFKKKYGVCYPNEYQQTPVIL